MSVEYVDGWKRSTTFKRPWKIDHRQYESKHDRTSSAIVDADGDVIVLIDPSEDEYDAACDQAASEAIVSLSK